jgi:segregation and condensation protein A
MSQQPNYHLEHFNGPLDLLLYLVQKDEVDVCDIFLKELTKQFQSLDIDLGAEFLGGTSLLLLMKSRRLLPKEEQIQSVEEGDFRYEVMQQLIEYYRLKEAALTLVSLESASLGYFPRKVPGLPKREGQIEEVKIEELQHLVQELIQKAERLPKKLMADEEFDIGDRINWLRQTLAQNEYVTFDSIFSLERTKGELIVFFLATLELMKLQEIIIIKKDSTILIYAKSKSI